MIIYTKYNTIINTAVVAFIDMDEGCDSVNIFANLVDGTPIKISEHETIAEAQAMLDRIYACFDWKIDTMDLRKEVDDK